ncbi:DegT/DnrJ/EryC1/StrS family aminotransferase [Erythrobacteraceae bacterium CFH 75059]|uniref:DegT/DnrJ/EryC1/StrS family aminotransferase n=1 Tax=Qipengyuania thermophila TaxID=2509361 RepID=UPI0010229662|nr:DegT/DnrJ/EryC1/StrS family aminotransferase [Qipengyuania thermophila]TCD04326.1 DegT/DnrJ/EryC1/StrS family aminotransferase [Erythrobacteraceae bacterium CFH 75059]
MRVPFLDLAAVDDATRRDLLAAAERVVSRGWFILGKEVEEFERLFAEYCGAPSAVGVGNGLDALSLALTAASVGPGDEVIVPSNTFIATWLAVTHVGATIVPVEPCEETYNLDPARVEMAITPATRALIAVHLYGQPADLDPLRSLAERHGLALIEDAAQAHGARYKGRRIGSDPGSVAAWSFYPGKNLGALGDGGAVTCSKEHAQNISMLRNYGSHRKYCHEAIGVNSRLDEIQAAFLIVKLTRLDRDNARRRDVAAYYNSELPHTDLLTPMVPTWAEPVWHLYVIRHPERDRLAAHLKAHGVETGVHYPVPPHLQPAYRHLGWQSGAFPLSETLHQQVLSLPISPFMSEADVDHVVKTIRKF